MVRWAIGRLGGASRSEGAAALLGIDDTRGWTQRARWDKVALILGYKTGDSFRHGKDHGRNVLETILDEIAGRLCELAEEHEFNLLTLNEGISEADVLASLRFQRELYGRPD